VEQQIKVVNSRSSSGGNDTMKRSVEEEMPEDGNKQILSAASKRSLNQLVWQTTPRTPVPIQNEDAELTGRTA